MKRFAITSMVCTAFLAGCGGPIKLLEDGRSHSGTYNSMTNEVFVSIDGKPYRGKYTENAGLGFGQAFGKAGAATATSVISDGSGSAYLTSDDGKVIECRFSTGFTGGQGRCESMDGRRFVLVIGG